MTFPSIRQALSAVVAVALISIFTNSPAPAYTQYIQLQTQLMNELQNTPSLGARAGRQWDTQKTNDWAAPTKWVIHK